MLRDFGKVSILSLLSDLSNSNGSRMSFKDLVSKIGRLSAIYLDRDFILRFIGIILLPIFTHYLSPAQLGIVNLSNRVIFFLSVFILCGVDSAFQSQYFRTDESFRPQLTRTLLFGQTFLMGSACLALSISGIWTAEYLLPNLPLTREHLILLWFMVVWTGFFAALNLLARNLMQLHERAGIAVSLNIGRYLLQTTLGITALVILGWKGFGRQGTFLMGAAGAALFSVCILWRHGAGPIRWSHFWRLLRLGFAFVPHNLTELLALTVKILGASPEAFEFPDLKIEGTKQASGN